MPVNWSLANQPSSFDNALSQGVAFGKMAREARDRKEMRSALAAYAANPEDKQAAAAIFQQNPELGARLMDRADEAAFKRDMSEYLTNGSGNALLGIQAGSAMPNALQGMPGPITGFGGGTYNMDGSQATPVNGTSLPIAEQGASFEEAFAPIARDAQPMNDNPSVDLSILGQPRTRQDEAFLRMVQRDPVKALKIQSDLRDNFVNQLKAEHEFYGVAADQLTRVNDEQSWQVMLGDMERRAQALGFTLRGKVPENYPGPEGVQALLEKAMPAKERMSYLLRQANVDADNARSDRNTDSLISTREGRLDEYRRHNRTTEGNTRRGQDMRDTTQRRGQDIRGAGGKSGGSSAPPSDTPITASGEHGEKYVLKGGKWVRVN